jgi:ParB-like chromosome segregation protein Spo0J
MPKRGGICIMNMMAQSILKKAEVLFAELEQLEESAKIETINAIRQLLHQHSPFANEPIDCVQWISGDQVEANDYNPNVVAPPEMKLLEHSIQEDGFTQPIVTWFDNNHYEVVDGFHRNRVGKESLFVNARIKGYLPLVIVNKSRQERSDRIAATIRHNRARGKHQVSGMSDIVLELKGRNWKNERIARELGMDEDEILRLCQITGLAGLFSDQDFSKAWDLEESEADFIPLDDDLGSNDENGFRHLNVDDENRIFHTYKKWECYKAGFYATTKAGMTRKQCEEAYRDFIADSKRFSDALEHVITEWKYSCEHYLTNVAMNRIAWLGQAAVCYAIGVPAAFRGGFNLLSEQEQVEANEIACVYLNKWLKANDRDEVTLEEAISGRQMDIY